MTREELEKLAAEKAEEKSANDDAYNCEEVWGFEQGFIAGYEMAAKRIEELEILIEGLRKERWGKDDT